MTQKKKRKKQLKSKKNKKKKLQIKRRLRKQLRKQKNKESSKSKSAKKKEKEVFKAEVKTLAKIMDNMPPPRRKDFAFKKRYCKKCKSYFCWQGGQQENYCTTCGHGDNQDEPLPEGMFYTGCQIPRGEDYICLNCEVLQ